MGAINKKYTTEEFIEKARQIHGNLYCYSNVVYVGAHVKVSIICNTCGEVFSQKAYVHLQGQGCPTCGRVKRGKSKTKRKECFIEQAKKIHGDRYSYQKTEYKAAKEKVCITCPKHGDFWQKAYVHLLGHWCPACRNDKNSEKEKRSQEEFINIANKRHNGKYSYEKTKYTLSKLKICVTCPKHGDFWVNANAHLLGVGCNSCWEERRGKSLIKKYQDFINEAKEKHGNKYDYSLITEENYIDRTHKIPIICKEHGVFYQIPKSHLKGCGCPHCPPSTISVGEDTIGRFLKSKNIEYIPQYKLNNDVGICDNKNFLVDFYIKSNNLIIEYNGQQHYHPSGYFGGKEKFKKTQKRDEALSEYCLKHGIKLLIIPYWEINNIESIINKNLKK